MATRRAGTLFVLANLRYTDRFAHPERVWTMSLIAELWDFIRERKKWVLLPIFVIMLLVGSLLVFAQGSALAPFIYTLF